ncbi:MAG TPA: DinB family protein [Chitinophagaceae bacterium]|nr:DinB family protein [Chitinophagaceae bacterium]
MKEFIETWHIHNRINLYLIAGIDENHFTAISASKGRTVGEQWAHIHNVRLMWLKASAPNLLVGINKIEKEQSITKEQVTSKLSASATAIATLLEKGFTDGKIKGFKPHPAAFLGYLISHESHHRGQIMLTLKQAGHPVDKKTAFGIWEWGSR